VGGHRRDITQWRSSDGPKSQCRVGPANFVGDTLSSIVTVRRMDGRFYLHVLSSCSLRQRDRASSRVRLVVAIGNTGLLSLWACVPRFFGRNRWVRREDGVRRFSGTTK